LLAGQHRIAAAKELNWKNYMAAIYYSDDLTAKDRLILQWNQSLKSKEGDLSQAIKQLESYIQQNPGTNFGSILPFMELVFRKGIKTTSTTNWTQKYIVAAKFPDSYIKLI